MNPEMKIEINIIVDGTKYQARVSNRLAPKQKLMRMYGFMTRSLVQYWSPSSTQSEVTKFVNGCKRDFVKRFSKL